MSGFIRPANLPEREARRHVTPPGESSLVGAALAIGIMLMGIQLWLLTIALEEFERHNYGQIYALAAISAAIFLGGAVMLRVLRRAPSVRRTSVPSSSSDHNA